MNTFPISPTDPAADLTRLDEMRRAIRSQALEHLAEADRLDVLYAAVTGKDQADVAQDEVQS
ncbi:hypothetical protein [Shimia haliotis]|uniref:Uncharacterized protein n=1 Tax=Shimia haliotis TaxID=1280847 RepID=A0A1I4C861_9RHOB|nr:hypothetical protein [Shimia haliotis]SFK77338.1 hypothetical protein SAMN04488036_102119 [Shimia haliotis]